ncbi:MAG: hypothetical protein ABSA42_13875 [Terracidiphilus sp.]
MLDVEIRLVAADALAEQADVLILKHAQALYGLDRAVVESLAEEGTRFEPPKPWKFLLLDAPKSVCASRVLIVGVPPMREFGYKDIRVFARTAIAALAREAPQTEQVLLTLHGAGYGLDEGEAFEAEIAGLVDAVRGGDRPPSLSKITIVERNSGRASRLDSKLAELIPNRVISRAGIAPENSKLPASEALRSAGYDSSGKAHVFVAMPFNEDMDDVYHYGIQNAVNAAGFLCERSDVSSFTGDVMEWVRSRIRTASLVVADLTDSNPNVYLEVGYAWGVGIPTVLLVRGIDHVKFDVRGQRCLIYKKIKDLEESLTKELKLFKTGYR